TVMRGARFTEHAARSSRIVLVLKRCKIAGELIAVVQINGILANVAGWLIAGVVATCGFARIGVEHTNRIANLQTYAVRATLHAAGHTFLGAQLDGKCERWVLVVVAT